MSERTCGVPECERQVLARGWCNAHYIRWRNTGEPGPAKVRRRGGNDAQCEYPGCERKHEAHGLCPGHLYQKRSGREMTPLQARMRTTDRDHLGRKHCRVCGEWLPTSSFFNNPTPKDGLHNRCVRCHRSERLLRNYGITLNEYELLLQSQGGVCKICGSAERGGKGLAVDHDHACCPGGKSCGQCIRGLLCNRCNMGLGYFRDAAALLVTAARYLKTHEAQSE